MLFQLHGQLGASVIYCFSSVVYCLSVIFTHYQNIETPSPMHIARARRLLLLVTNEVFFLKIVWRQYINIALSSHTCTLLLIHNKTVSQQKKNREIRLVSTTNGLFLDQWHHCWGMAVEILERALSWRHVGALRQCWDDLFCGCCGWVCIQRATLQVSSGKPALTPSRSLSYPGEEVQHRLRFLGTDRGETSSSLMSGFF